MKKILFVGHTGLRKKTVLHTLATEIEQHCPEYRNLVKSYELEDYIKQAAGEDPALFPIMKSAAKMREVWVKGWELLTQTIKDENPRGCSLVSTHLIFYRHSRLVAPARLDLIAEWSPDTVVTLIDDVFAVRNRINFKGYHFMLRELYTWRMAEWLMADQVAWAIGTASRTRDEGSPKHIPNFLLSVKHPVHMLFRLLFRQNIPRVYASFPISSTRDNEEIKKEINDFRSRLHKLFTVFDPLTIDERIMNTWATEATSKTIRFDFTTGPPKRWDCRINSEHDGGNYAPLLWDNDLQTAEIDVSEIQDLQERICIEGESDTDDQITFRDYRLIDQADYVVCYRPNYQNKYHGGVDAEISYANDTTRPVYAFLSNDSRPGRPLKGRIDHTYRDKATFWRAMEQLKQKGPDLDLRKGRVFL